MRLKPKMTEHDSFVSRLLQMLVAVSGIDRLLLVILGHEPVHAVDLLFSADAVSFLVQLSPEQYFSGLERNYSTRSPLAMSTSKITVSSNKIQKTFCE